MSSHDAPSGLGFYLRTDIIEWKDGSCRPATGEEMALWACIREQQAALQAIANDASIQTLGQAMAKARAVGEKWRIEP